MINLAHETSIQQLQHGLLLKAALYRQSALISPIALRLGPDAGSRMRGPLEDFIYRHAKRHGAGIFGLLAGLHGVIACALHIAEPALQSL
jgi:hypothetical protein